MQIVHFEFIYKTKVRRPTTLDQNSKSVNFEKEVYAQDKSSRYKYIHTL